MRARRPRCARTDDLHDGCRVQRDRRRGSAARLRRVARRRRGLDRGCHRDRRPAVDQLSRPHFACTHDLNCPLRTRALTPTLRLMRSLAPWVALLGIACAPDPIVVERTPLVGPFTTRGSQIVDGDGGTLLLRGGNLSGTSKYPPFTPSEMDGDGRARLAQLGPMTLRYIVTWAAIEPTPGVHDTAFLADLEERAR